MVMDQEQARINMLKQQIHTYGVFDHHLLAILAKVPREDFVPEAYRELAFADMAIPLPHEQQMFAPKEEARALQALAIKPTDTILEIGTGTGYLTALLAQLGSYVFSVDIFPDFVHDAEQKLLAHRINNVILINVDAVQGWREQAPYDVVVVSGGLPELPAKLQEDLKVGGRLFCILGEAPAMTATVITREDRHVWSKQTLFETVTPVLLNAVQPVIFEF